MIGFTITITNSEAKGHAKRIKFNPGLASYYFWPSVTIYPWIWTHIPYLFHAVKNKINKVTKKQKKNVPEAFNAVLR